MSVHGIESYVPDVFRDFPLWRSAAVMPVIIDKSPDSAEFFLILRRRPFIASNIRIFSFQQALIRLLEQINIGLKYGTSFYFGRLPPDCAAVYSIHSNAATLYGLEYKIPHSPRRRGPEYTIR